MPRLSSESGRPVDIPTWLLQIPDSCFPEAIDEATCQEHHPIRRDQSQDFKQLRNKRKRRAHLVSPPASDLTASSSASDAIRLPPDMADSCSTPSAKRKKLHHHSTNPVPAANPAQDPDATPTQHKKITSIYPPSMGTHTPTASETSADSRSDISGRSSPVKKLAALSVADKPLQTLEFAKGVQTPTGPALDMFDNMEYLENNEGLIPGEMRAAFDEYAKKGKIARIGSAAFDDSGKRKKLGPTPTVEAVLDVLQEAMRCQETVHTEHGWNCSVHFPLLKLAVHGSHGRQKQLVDFDSCTHAKPLAVYRPSSTTWLSHMVDFCITLSPRQVEGNQGRTVRAIDQLRTQLAENSINHTGHNPLLRDPIAVSIETKRPAEGDQKQALQIGVWQTAQWRHLEKLVERRLLADGNMSSPGGRTLEERRDEILDRLGYLPAVFVRGHEWSFAATTRTGQKTVLWREVPLGTTRNVLGIYRIIYAIQLLVEYSRDQFWPWYVEAVLGLTTAEDATSF